MASGCSPNFNSSATGNATDNGLGYEIAINILLYLLVFGLAGTVDFDTFKKRFAVFKGIAIGLFSQFILLPLIGFLIVLCFNEYYLPDEIVLASILIIMVSSPGGSYSNWWCSLCNADLALSVAMTTVSVFLSMGFLPLNIYLYATLGLANFNGGSSTPIALPWDKLGISLGIVIAGIVTGLLVGYKFPQYHPHLNVLGQLAGGTSIILGLVFSNSGATNLFQKPIPLYFSVGLPCIFALMTGVGMATLARIPKPQRVAVAIETSYQNTSVALAVAISLRTDFGIACAQDAAAIPALYGFAEVLFIGLFAIISWQLGWTYSPRTDNIFKVIFTSYQHLADDEEYVNGAGMKAKSDKIVATGKDDENFEERSPTNDN